MVLNLFMVFLFKLLSFFRILNCRREARSVNIHPLDTLNPNPDPTHNTDVENITEDHVRPCLERLQRLETLCSEISGRRAEIPLEKECALLDSWNRIKTIECDLEKTKKVSLQFVYLVSEVRCANHIFVTGVQFFLINTGWLISV